MDKKLRLVIDVTGVTAELEVDPNDTGHDLLKRAIEAFVPPMESNVGGATLLRDGAAIELHRSIEDQGIENGALLQLVLTWD